MPDARKFFHAQQPFAMRRGGTLPGFRLAWESWGQLNASKDNAVLILTGLSPDAHAASSDDNPEPGWWEFMVGPGKPINSERWFVICVNSLGSCKGSTGPASEHPEGQRPWATDFPALALEDIANSTYLLLQSLGIEQLAVLIGPSMGGMTALALALNQPHYARHLVSISSAPYAEPFSIAIRSLQREVIRSDRHWNNGRYHDGELPTTGMRLARKLGVISYRSAREWRQRFARQRMAEPSGIPFAPEFEIESYLEAHAERFVGGFDPNSYIYLSRAMDWFDVSEYAPTVTEALGQCGFSSALVIGVDTDILFPLHQQKEIAESFTASGVATDFHALPSIQGHDAFLVDQQQFSTPVANFLAGL